MTPSRPSLNTEARQEESHWKRVIRWFAVVAAILGLLMIGNEILENIISHGTSKVHLSTMLWGITLLSFGLLIIQRGDVSTSVREVTAAGDVVSTWWRKGRGSDKPGTVVQTTVAQPTADVPTGHPKEEDLSHD